MPVTGDSNPDPWRTLVPLSARRQAHAIAAERRAELHLARQGMFDLRGTRWARACLKVRL